MNQSTRTIAANTKYKSAKVNTGRSNWMSSKNCKIEIVKGQTEMNFELRQSRPGAAINGELKVKNSVARHGKINVSVFQQILNHLGTRFDLPEKNTLNKQSHDKDPVLIQKVYELATKLDKASHVTLDEFKAFVVKADDDWLGSKYEAMIIIEAFTKLSSRDRETAVERLYSQAATANELSGPYLKVSQRTE